MLSRSSEKVIRFVRWGLVAGWLAIIGLCVHDFGLSAVVTDPESDYAVPGLAATSIDARGETIPAQPYNLGPRLFWGTAIPIVVLLLVIAGHETWRRICPLSAIAQLPRTLGLQRKRLVGKQRQVALVDGESWWARHALFIQFLLFGIGVCLRLTVLSAHPLALAITTAAIFGLALIVGLLFGGKTWCHFVCPMNAVQLVINGPRGLGDSKATDGVGGVSQSMCRRPGSPNDLSNCVGCNSPCPDVDLERNYWERLATRQRRLVVYGYLGIVVGFLHVLSLTGPGYGGAIWYDTNWSAPGWTVGSTTVPIPRYVTTPLTIFAWIFVTMAVFSVVEGVLVSRAQKRAEKQSELIAERTRHRLITVVSAVALAVLVMVAALPGLRWLGGLTTSVIGMVAVASLGMWTYRTWNRTSSAFHRETMAASLRRRLTQLPLDLTPHLQGRAIEELTSDEVHLLADLVPRLEKDGQLKFYEKVLSDAINTGNAHRSEGRQVLERMRERIGISEEEHHALYERLQQEDLAEGALNQTRILRTTSYQQQLERIILEGVERGQPLQQVIQDQQSAIVALREEYGISDEEEERVLNDLGADSGMLRRAGELLIEQFHSIHNLMNGLDSARPSQNYLVQHLTKETEAVVVQCLGVLEALGESPEVTEHLAARMLSIDPTITAAVACDPRGSWDERLSPSVYARFTASDSTIPPSDSEESTTVDLCLKQLSGYEDDITALVAVRAGLELGLAEASQWQQQLFARTEKESIKLVIQALDDTNASRLAIQVLVPDSEPILCYDQSIIGRSSRADITIDQPQMSRQHCRLSIHDGQAWIEDLGGLNGTFVDQQIIRQERIPLPQNCEFRAARDAQSIQLRTVALPQEQGDDPLSLFLLLSAAPLFAALPSHELLDLAIAAEPLAFQVGDVLVSAGEPLQHVVVVTDGQAEARAGDQVLGVITVGDPIGELALFTGDTASASVIATVAGRAVVWPSRVFEAMLSGRSAVASDWLRLVSRRLVDTLRSVHTPALTHKE